MAQKGSQFERDMCRLFSRWVSGGDRDDLFWRTSQSGGRATSCSRRGAALKAKGFYGDMALVDTSHETAKLFADNVSVEFKRGYNRASLQDLLDLPARAATRTVESFLEQASSDATASGRLWLLVWKRDSRDPIVVMPTGFTESLACKTLSNFRCAHDSVWHDCLIAARFTAVSLESFFRSILVQGVPYEHWRTKETPRTSADA